MKNWHSLLVISTLVAGTFAQARAAEAPPKAEVDWWLPENALPSLIRKSQGTEKRFFEAMQANPDARLLEKLRVPAVPKSGESAVTGSLMQRKRLRWEAVLDEGENAPRVLIFDSNFKSWPGSQSIVIVLLGSDGRVLSWLESGGEPIFASATLETQNAQIVLQTRSLVRRKGSSTIVNGLGIEHFTFEENAIRKTADLVAFSQPQK